MQNRVTSSDVRALILFVIAWLLVLGQPVLAQVSGVPSRLRVNTLGVGTAAPATTGDVAIGDDLGVTGDLTVSGAVSLAGVASTDFARLSQANTFAQGLTADSNATGAADYMQLRLDQGALSLRIATTNENGNLVTQGWGGNVPAGPGAIITTTTDVPLSLATNYTERLRLSSSGVAVNGQVLQRIAWAAVTSTGTILSDFGITSITDGAGDGNWTVNFDASFFASTPACTCSSNLSSTGACLIGASTSNTAFQLRTSSSGVFNDTGFHVICAGL